MKLLHIDSSILGEASASRTVSREIVAQYQASMPGLEVTHVDLAAESLPHLTAASLAKADETTAARDARALADFLAADVIVIGAPMYNFGIASQLKAWIDRILVAGQTFRYTERGPQGLATGKRVIVAVSRGNFYAANAPGEHVEPYLRFVFNFIGITDVRFVRAEGLAISPESRQKGVSAALADVPRLVGAAAAAA